MSNREWADALGDRHAPDADPHVDFTLPASSYSGFHAELGPGNPAQALFFAIRDTRYLIETTLPLEITVRIDPSTLAETFNPVLTMVGLSRYQTAEFDALPETDCETSTVALVGQSATDPPPSGPCLTPVITVARDGWRLSVERGPYGTVDRASANEHTVTGMNVSCPIGDAYARRTPALVAAVEALIGEIRNHARTCDEVSVGAGPGVTWREFVPAVAWAAGLSESHRVHLLTRQELPMPQRCGTPSTVLDLEELLY